LNAVRKKEQRKFKLTAKSNRIWNYPRVYSI
jgi:hypothetical protein